MNALTWILGGMSLLAGVACIGWLKARQDARDWANVCACLGHEYDKLIIELNTPKPRHVVEQRTRWLN